MAAAINEILRGQYAARGGDAGPRRHLSVLNWNIERGANLPGVMDFIRSQQPDLCILQEVDLNTKRTGNTDVADVLAADLGFNYVFGTEWEELGQRSGGEPAFQGQAILARRLIGAPRVLRFSRQSEVWHPRWYLPRWSIFQPRRGGRMALAAELVFGRTGLVIYNLHLESHGDDRLRLWQLSEVVYDSLRYSWDTPVLIAGDFNTRKFPSPLQDYLAESGFRDACTGSECRGTKPSGETLDWIFVRGPAVCSETKSHREITASDHYPLSTTLTLTNG